MKARLKKSKILKKNVLICSGIALLAATTFFASLYSRGKNEYSKEYQTITNELIQKNYTTLSDKKINVIEWDLFHDGSAFALPTPFVKTLGVSTKVRNYNDDAIKGLLAHELAHFENNQKKNVFYFIRWMFDKDVKAEYERTADERVIELGLGKYLLESVEADIKLGTKKSLEERYSSGGYLSREKIKNKINNLNINSN